MARFAEAGADVVTFHYEATYNPKGCIEMIRNAGAKVGVSIKPATSVEGLRDILPQIDLVLIMSVEPGFGGQTFIPASLEKIAQLRALADELGTETIIEVDGGISSHNAHEVFGAGADVLVAGNAVFGAEDPPGRDREDAQRLTCRPVSSSSSNRRSLSSAPSSKYSLP